MRLPGLFSAFLLLACALGPTQATATLLYAGGEDTDFVCKAGSCAVTTTSFTFRPTWARAAYQVAGTDVDPATNRFATAPFTASSAIWVHAQYCNNYASKCNNLNTLNAQMLRVMNSSGNAAPIVRGTGTTGQLKISKRSSAGSFTDLVTCPSVLLASLQQIDLYVDYQSSGEVRLYVNGQQICNYTGNVTNGYGATTLNQVELSSAILYWSGDGSGAWSEVIVATTDTRAMSRFTANTVANGNTVGFTGTNVCSAIWAATAYNDSSYAYTASTNVTHECTIRNSLPAGAFGVVGLVMSARSLVGATGPLNFNFVTRTGGTDYLSSDFAPLPAFSNISNYIQTVNPATSSAWSISDFTDSGFNVGQKSKP